MTGRRPRLLVLMGSGETAPTMIKPHREIFDRLGDEPIRAVMLDTPFGFQENADSLVDKSLQYFDESVGREVRAAGLRRSDTGDTVAVEQALSRIRTADWLFAGPGSPTFTLRQWSGTAVPDVLADKLQTGGALVFSSAAALTLGLRTIPVYEVYKVGADPFWLDGLDLLSALGLPVSVIPHYDNNEGGNHDTRMCYLGEGRLRMIEDDLPDGSFILGIDEHTGVTLDLDADTAEVFGKGVLTLRTAGTSVTIPAGTTVPIDVLRQGGRGGTDTIADGAESPSAGQAPIDGAGEESGASLLEDVRSIEQRFAEALDDRDADGAVAALLAVDDAIDRWSADTNQSDDLDRARAARRSMIVRLGVAASRGVRDPRTTVAPILDAVLELRRVVREEKRYDLSDLLRDQLITADIEVRDGTAGAEWKLGESWTS